METKVEEKVSFCFLSLSLSLCLSLYLSLSLSLSVGNAQRFVEFFLSISRKKQWK